MPNAEAFPAHREWHKRVPNWARESDHAVIAISTSGGGAPRPEHALEELLREQVTLYLKHLAVDVPTPVVNTAIRLIAEDYILGKGPVSFTLSKEHLHGFLVVAKKRLGEAIPHALVEDAAARAYALVNQGSPDVPPFDTLPVPERVAWIAGAMQSVTLAVEWERKRAASDGSPRFWPEVA